jgi:retron-type reverse transcriptase
VILSVDIMYFTGLYFLITVSRGIIFITAMILQDRKKATILKAIQQVCNVYKSRGHNINEMEFVNQQEVINTILADNEFQALQEEIEEIGINVHLVSKCKHVPEVERQNRVIKGRA